MYIPTTILYIIYRYLYAYTHIIHSPHVCCAIYMHDNYTCECCIFMLCVCVCVLCDIYDIRVLLHIHLVCVCVRVCVCAVVCAYVCSYMSCEMYIHMGGYSIV